MKSFLLLFLIFFLISFSVPARDNFSIKGLCIGAPAKADIDEFIAIIDSFLAPAGVNTMILRVDFGYRYQSHPELVNDNPLEKK